jgi:hypothetical protein
VLIVVFRLKVTVSAASTAMMPTAISAMRGPPMRKQAGRMPMACPTVIATASAGRLTRLPADEADAAASGVIDTCDIARLESKKA